MLQREGEPLSYKGYFSSLGLTAQGICFGAFTADAQTDLKIPLGAANMETESSRFRDPFVPSGPPYP